MKGMNVTAPTGATRRTGLPLGAPDPLPPNYMERWLADQRTERREDFEAIRRETGFDSAIIKDVEASAVKAFDECETELDRIDAELVHALHVANDRYLETYRAEFGNGGMGAIRIGFASVSRDSAYEAASAEHKAKSKAAGAQLAHLQRIHHAMVKKFAPERAAEKSAAAMNWLLEGPRPPEWLPYNRRRAARTYTRPRSNRRPSSSTRSTRTASSRTTVAASAGGDSSGSPASGGTQGSSPASSADDPQPAGRIRHRHEWIVARVSTRTAGSPASFLGLAS